MSSSCSISAIGGAGLEGPASDSDAVWVEHVDWDLDGGGGTNFFLLVGTEDCGLTESVAALEEPGADVEDKIFGLGT